MSKSKSFVAKMFSKNKVHGNTTYFRGLVIVTQQQDTIIRDYYEETNSVFFVFNKVHCNTTTRQDHKRLL
ncbi:hypothetical protein AC249_AIPGENE922 [Exaiptasia diaphana]|nr:hypothetical protein AC249_AIPGENE922 [Exaiptasia diaphana]